MVKMSKLVEKFENSFFQDNVPRKMDKETTFPNNQKLPLKINPIPI
jgi:hypothetical protein